MDNKQYEQGQRVFFTLGENKPSGWATVEGVQGFVIIIKPEEQIPNYEYTHIYVMDSQLSDEAPSDDEAPTEAEE